MRMGQVKRCLGILSPARRLLIECECEEDADLLFAGISILSLGNESKKMADTRRLMKEKKLEDELAKAFEPSDIDKVGAEHRHHPLAVQQDKLEASI